MTDLLISVYPWTKVLHILAVISWMAGLLYLPRLFVNHVEQAPACPDIEPVFLSMERKLFTVIMQPAMMATWVFGLLLVVTPGVVDWGWVWPWVKAFCVLIMTGFHVWLGQTQRKLAIGENELTGRQLRFLNEVPTILMIVIITSVVVKF